MAGTNTITYDEVGVIKKVIMTWVSDASGDVDSTLTKKLNGQILRAVHVPDSGGTQPTNAYDVTIEDTDELDILDGTGANISNSAASQFCPSVTDGNAGNQAPCVVCSTLELKVANAGNAKGGKVILYMR